MDSQTRSQAIYFLKRNPLFNSLGDQILTELADTAKSVNLEQGSTLLREGEPADALYLIKSGRVHITSRTEKGDPQALAFLSRGDAVGELSLLTGENQPFGVVLDTACEFLVISKADFDDLLEHQPLMGI